MIMYRIHPWKTTIEPIEVIEVTGQYLVVAAGTLMARQMRVKNRGPWGEFFITFEEAKNTLTGRLKQKVKEAKCVLTQAEETLKQVEAMVPDLLANQ